MFITSEQKIRGEHRNHLETFSLHWHSLVLLINTPVGSKLHSPLLGLVYIGSPAVLFWMWVCSSSTARVFVQAGWQTMPACFGCRLLKCYFGGCVMMLECDSVWKTGKCFIGVSCRSLLSCTRIWVKGCRALHSYSTCTLQKHSSFSFSL